MVDNHTTLLQTATLTFKTLKECLCGWSPPVCDVSASPLSKLPPALLCTPLNVQGLTYSWLWEGISSTVRACPSVSPSSNRVVPDDVPAWKWSVYFFVIFFSALIHPCAYLLCTYNQSKGLVSLISNSKVRGSIPTPDCRSRNWARTVRTSKHSEYTKLACIARSYVSDSSLYFFCYTNNFIRASRLKSSKI